MNLKQLETFVRVAELGSFSKAAMVLRIAQPALSRQVRQLEIDLRETLLERTGRGVQLTEAGKRLLEHANTILQLVARARDDLTQRRDEPAGRVVLGMPPSIGRQLALPLVDAFRRQWPRARLTIVEGLSSYLAEWIATGRVDLALLHNPEPHESLEITPLLEEALCLVSPAPREAGRRPPKRARPPAPLPMRELSAHPLILPERTQTIRRLLETHAALAGVQLDIAWEVSSVPAILDLVAAGHGHAVLTASAVAISSHAAGLVARPLTDPRVTSTLCLGLSATKRPTPLLRRVSALLTTLVAELPRV